MPRASGPTEPELRIRFAYDEAIDAQAEVYATDFIAFYKDQFGSIIMTASPEAEWREFLKAIARAILHEDESAH